MPYLNFIPLKANYLCEFIDSSFHPEDLSGIPRASEHDPFELPDENTLILVVGFLFMDLFVLRHGKAGNATGGPDDAARTLTREGKEGITRIAEWMREQNFWFDTIATSPLKRARQTAAIVASELDQEARLAVWEELAPGGDPDTVYYHASQQGNDASVLIVGHEPALSRLISMIISGEGDCSIVLAKGGLAKIGNYSYKTRPSGTLRWLVTPKLIRKRR